MTPTLFFSPRFRPAKGRRCCPVANYTIVTRCTNEKERERESRDPATRFISTSGYLKHGHRPDTRDDISAASTRLGCTPTHGQGREQGNQTRRNTRKCTFARKCGHIHTRTDVHTRDSFAIGRNYGGNEGAVHRTTRINLHLRHPRGRHANSLSYCTPRRISRRTINFLRAVADSARYPVRSLCPFPGRTAPVPIGPEFPGWWIVASGCLSADERRFSLSG